MDCFILDPFNITYIHKYISCMQQQLMTKIGHIFEKEQKWVYWRA